jgi:hypothetical protein
MEFEQYLFEEFGLSSLALARLFLAYDPAVRNVNPPESSLAKELASRFSEGRLDVGAIGRLISWRDAFWQSKPRKPTLDPAVNLYLDTPSTFAIVKAIFRLDRKAIEAGLEFEFTNRWKFDELPAYLPKEFGQIMCQINSMHRPSKALVETLELRQHHINTARLRKSRHENCLVQAEAAESRLGVFVADPALILRAENAVRLALADKGESSNLRRMNFGETYRRTNADIVDDLAGALGIGIRIYGLSERYQYELFPGFSGRKFSEIFLEIAREDPRIFVNLLLRADYWWTRECLRPREAHEAAELIFKFYFRGLDMTYFWAVIAEGDWSKTGIHVRPWEDVKMVKLNYLAGFMRDSGEWLKVFLAIASSPNVKRYYAAHTKRAGQSWEDELRWRT